MKRPIIAMKEEENENEEESVKKGKKPDELKCELCDTVCSSISQLQRHTLSEHVPSRKPSPLSNPPTVQKVACQQCEDTFDNFAQFAIHMKSHISTPNPTFYCPICPGAIGFRDRTTHLEHITTQHLQIQVTQFVCTECDSIFATSTGLATHFWENHVKRKFLCSNCDFSTDSEKSFKEHSKTHSRQLTMYGCAMCGSAFGSQQNLIGHVQLVHEQDALFPSTQLLSKSTPPTQSPKPNSKPRPLQCSVCDETVIGEEGLDEHRLQRHCQVKYADKCADCHEPISTATSFVEHCLRHTRDHVHYCPVCRQSLRSDTQIHAHCVFHMQKIPKEEENDEDFSENGIEIKKEEFSFVCPICGEQLDDGFALYEHSKHHL